MNYKGLCALLVMFFLFGSGNTWAENFADCILDNMPGTQNQSVRAAVYRTCSLKHPARYGDIEKGSGLGLLNGIFSFSSGDACIIKKAATTPFQPAVSEIVRACRCLYDKSNLEGFLCNGNVRLKNGKVFDPRSAVLCEGDCLK